MSSRSGRQSWRERAARVGRTLENVSLALLLGAMLLIAGTQILLRNLGGGGLAWADEALRVMVLWLAMLGGIAASREDRHISIDALARVLPPFWRNLASACTAALTATVCLLIAWYALDFVAESREFGDQLLGGLPAWWFQSILPAGFGVIGYRYLVWALRRLLAMFRGTPDA